MDCNGTLHLLAALLVAIKCCGAHICECLYLDRESDLYQPRYYISTDWNMRFYCGYRHLSFLCPLAFCMGEVFPHNSYHIQPPIRGITLYIDLMLVDSRPCVFRISPIEIFKPELSNGDMADN